MFLVSNRAWAGGVARLILFQFFKDGPFRAFFFIFVFSFVLLVDKILPMSEFERQISGVVSDCSTNLATTTALLL